MHYGSGQLKSFAPLATTHFPIKCRIFHILLCSFLSFFFLLLRLLILTPSKKATILVFFCFSCKLALVASFKDVRAHCYGASLVRTLYMTWHVPRHVFQARAPSRNSGDLCGNLCYEYFCRIIGDPHFFFGRSLPFLILSIILKNKKNLCVGSFNYFLYTIQIGSNWYMDTGVRDLEVACFQANST